MEPEQDTVEARDDVDMLISPDSQGTEAAAEGPREEDSKKGPETEETNAPPAEMNPELPLRNGNDTLASPILAVLHVDR
jgi:hypothetical protein